MQDQLTIYRPYVERWFAWRDADSLGKAEPAASNVDQESSISERRDWKASPDEPDVEDWTENPDPNTTKESEEDPGATRLSIGWTPYIHTTVELLHDQYNAALQEWKASALCNYLVQSLERTKALSSIQVSNIVGLGLGSLHIPSWKTWKTVLISTN